ncbi:TIGR03757 family integrating conjugative element protein [Pasteurella oralis]|uniref:TIGR03757 family integrating conjugative element protein n=1 Tax=Pasteurella oralis TaxID=1071947 RepID=UPI000C7E5AD7|nr:TIGR03757 family integrating conjugative element protein [Pasteurella oralis]
MRYLIFFFFNLFPVLATAYSISVYTTQHYPISNAQLADHIYMLDAVEQLEEKLSVNLSIDPETASIQVKNKMDTEEWKNTEQALVYSYNGVISGWQIGIKKVPAIVFSLDNSSHYAVYGATDIKHAIQLYQQYQQSMN